MASVVSAERPLVAVVSGASNGIGRATAVALGARGMHVWLVGRDVVRLEQTAEAVRAAHEDARAHPCVADLTVRAEVDALAARLLAAGDELAVLVHAAGVAQATTSAASAADDFDAHHLINVRAPMQLTEALLPLVRRARGAVVVVNSMSALQVAAGFAGYASSKAAARSWADVLRAEEALRGVRVCSVYPAQVATDMQEAIVRARGGTYDPGSMLQASDVADLVGYVVDHPWIELADVTVRRAKD